MYLSICLFLGPQYFLDVCSSLCVAYLVAFYFSRCLGGFVCQIIYVPGTKNRLCAVCLSKYQSTFLPVWLSFNRIICLSFCLSVCLSVSLCVCQSAYLSVFACLHPACLIYVCVSICLSILHKFCGLPAIYLSVWLFVCLPVCSGSQVESALYFPPQVRDQQ